MAGSFVAVSSVSARLVDRNMGVYCASKAALSMLVKVAAAEWGAARAARQRGGARRDAHAHARARAAGDRRGLALAGRRGRAHRAGPAGRGRRHRRRPSSALHAMDWVTGQVVECDGGLSLHSPIDSYGDDAAPRDRDR